MKQYRSVRAKRRIAFRVAFALSAAVLTTGFVLMAVYGLNEDGSGLAGSLFFLGMVASVITAIGAFRKRTPEEKREDAVYKEASWALDAVRVERSNSLDENIQIAAETIGTALRRAAREGDFLFAIPVVIQIRDNLYDQYGSRVVGILTCYIEEHDPQILEAVNAILEHT